MAGPSLEILDLMKNETHLRRVGLLRYGSNDDPSHLISEVQPCQSHLLQTKRQHTHSGGSNSLLMQ